MTATRVPDTEVETSVPAPVGASLGETAVELRHVTKSFGSRRVLDDVSLTVTAGQAVCILGRSGTGKSVTLKSIMGLIKPDAGDVLVQGRSISTISRTELSDARQGMGMLFQNAALFDSISVGENVGFPLARHRRLSSQEVQERAQALLTQVGLADEYDKMPSDLSGGMRKRAGLARALALEPALLLVDEPSAGLDPITSAEIDELLAERKRASGMTLLIVTHNIPSARALGDQLVFLHEGRILEQGTADQLERSDNDLVRHFMGSRSSG